MLKSLRSGKVKLRDISIAALVLLLVASVAIAGGRDERSEPFSTRSQLTTEPVALTYWTPNYFSRIGVKNYSELEFYKMLESETGITLDFYHPSPSISLDTALQLRIDAGEVPDIIELEWHRHYEQGADGAIDDGVILPLDDLIEAYSPSYRAVLLEHPEVDALVRSARGNLYGYPYLLLENELRNYQTGPVVRSDWLKIVDLSPPETIGDWDEMLKKFRDSEKIDAGLIGAKVKPFAMLSDQNSKGSRRRGFGNFWLSNLFAGAFGIGHYYYVTDGEIRFGPIQPEYRELLKWLRNWYADGLMYIDLDESARGEDIVRSSGAFMCGPYTSGVGSWWTDYSDLTPVAYPTRDGSTSDFVGPSVYASFFWGNSTAAISASNPYPELSAQLLDLGYSEQGRLSYAFGAENVTYRMEEGKPLLVEEILSNAREAFGGKLRGNPSYYLYGFPVKLVHHSRGFNSGPYLANLEFRRQIGVFTAPSVWFQNGGVYDVVHSFFGVGYSRPLPEELVAIEEKIDPYLERMFFAFIRGEEPLDLFGRYVAQIEEMGIDRALALLRSVYPKY